MVYRILSVGFALLFGSFALLQFNDPDPMGWLVVYMSTALIHVRAAQNHLYILPTISGAIGAAVAAVMYWPSEYQGIAGVMKTEVPQIELARESLGLSLVSISLFFLSIRAYRKQALNSM